MRSTSLALALLLVPAVASAASPAICDDQRINVVHTTVGVGCPIYAVNPTARDIELDVAINGGARAQVTVDRAAIPLTITKRGCDAEVCEDVTTTEARTGELLRVDMPELVVGDTVYVTTSDYFSHTITVTGEPCAAAPATFVVATCAESCAYVEACDPGLGVGCSAAPASGASTSWALPLLALGVAMACGARRNRRTPRQTARGARASTGR